MTNKELQKKLKSLKEKLKLAHDKNDTTQIDYYLRLINELWQKASVEMLKNAEEDALYKPDKS